MDTKIYAIANQKGGVGKTTSVINIASILGSRGFRTLVVDLDPQANATSGLGYNKHEADPSAYDLLLQDVALDQVIRNNMDYRLDMLPSNPSLAGAEVELVSLIGREYRLAQAMEPAVGHYDYVFIDCPPSLGLLTVNALAAATHGVLIPVQCEYLALEGLTQLMQTIELVQKVINSKLVIRGLIMTMYDSRTNLSRQVVEEVRQYFPDKVFRTIIPRNIRLSEAPSYGQPINIYAPKSAGAIAYQLLAIELLKGDQHKVEKSI